MLFQILNITAPIFLLGAVGFIWARSGIPYDMPFVTRLGVQFAVPCLIFSVLATAEIEPQAFSELAVAALAAHAVMGTIFALILLISGLSMRAFMPPLTFANTGNMGLAVCLFAYGETGLALGMVYFAISAGLSFSIGIWIAAGGARSAEALRQPMVYACAAGAVFAWQDWSFPGPVMNAIRLAGDMAIPLMLVTLGVSTASLKVADVLPSAGLTIMKLVITSACAVLIVWLFGLTGPTLGVVALQMIMPAGITTYIIAARYDAQPDAVAGLVVISTVISIAAIPVALGVLIG